jgi:ATP phosphoribosyltransferase regulatory subunit HisZ
MEALPPSFGAAQERREVTRDALARLEDELAGPSASPTWRTEVTSALAELRAAFAAHIDAVEADDGFLADILEEAPRLTAAVNQLEREHVHIPSQIDALLAALATDDPRAIREDALALMQAVVRHRQAGSDLVYEAYATDIGGQSGS